MVNDIGEKVDALRGGSQRRFSFSSKEFLITAIISIVLAIIFRMFFAEFVMVEGESMLDTIEPKEKVFVLKLASFKRGDIVIVKNEAGSEILIKRVVALEGDTVEIKDGMLYVNDEEQDERYVKEPMMKEDYSKITLQDGEFFVLGDNRNFSHDSRRYGPYELKDYKGKAVFGYKSGKFKNYMKSN